jgi:hypothetical protein
LPGDWSSMPAVGMPFAAPRRAYWLLAGLRIQLRRTDYDFEEATGPIRATPRAETLAVRYFVNPPTDGESLKMFAGAELS